MRAADLTLALTLALCACSANTTSTGDGSGDPASGADTNSATGSAGGTSLGGAGGSNATARSDAGASTPPTQAASDASTVAPKDAAPAPSSPPPARDAGSPPPPPPPPPTPSADSGANADAAQLCVDTINAYRATLGLAPYARWTSAEACSDGEAQSDSQTGKAHGAFGRCGEWAQNECPGWSGPPGAMITSCLKMMWAEGPGGGHYENMRGKYKRAACGFYVLPNGSVWAVQNFQ